MTDMDKYTKPIYDDHYATAKEPDAQASECCELLETRLHIPTIGTGTLRTSATWIAVMLMAEDPNSRADVLVSIMKELGITPQQIADEYNDTMCSRCGISMLAHRDNGGECF